MPSTPAPRIWVLLSIHVPFKRREQASKHIIANIRLSLAPPHLQETPELSTETSQMYKSTKFQIIPIG
jgi:hypothetical protein